jgi:hypothetical protein
VCKKYYGNKYNYILAMYYVSNIEKLGENKTITYANKYINNLTLGCKYHDQEEINKMMPNIDSTIPESFIHLLNE